MGGGGGGGGRSTAYPPPPTSSPHPHTTSSSTPQRLPSLCCFSLFSFLCCVVRQSPHLLLQHIVCSNSCFELNRAKASDHLVRLFVSCCCLFVCLFGAEQSRPKIGKRDGLGCRKTVEVISLKAKVSLQKQQLLVTVNNIKSNQNKSIKQNMNPP